MSNKQRLDQLLVEGGLMPSRARARDAILRGSVYVAGVEAHKAGQMVAADADITVADAAADYVSRAALKLLHGLGVWPLDLNGKYGLDIGAATGGFTQVLLKSGVAHVDAIDVGHGQMAAEIAQDSRVNVVEGLNARALELADLTYRPDVIVSDVSFISLKLALPKALALAASGAVLLALIKPQFEAGRKAIGKGGLVHDDKVRERVCAEIVDWLESEQNWRVIGVTSSPVRGGDGNQEYLVLAKKPCV